MEVVGFRATLAAGEKVTLSERIKGASIIEGLRMKFYPGQEGTLHIRPTLWQTGRNSLVDLVTYPADTNNYLSGDDDYFDFPITLEALLDDELRLYCENTGAFPYTVSVDITVDYFGGVNRVVGGVTSGG